jgi:hypothetical protein
LRLLHYCGLFFVLILFWTSFLSFFAAPSKKHKKRHAQLFFEEKSKSLQLECMIKLNEKDMGLQEGQDYLEAEELFEGIEQAVQMNLERNACDVDDLFGDVDLCVSQREGKEFEDLFDGLEQIVQTNLEQNNCSIYELFDDVDVCVSQRKSIDEELHGLDANSLFQDIEETIQNKGCDFDGGELDPNDLFGDIDHSVRFALRKPVQNSTTEVYDLCFSSQSKESEDVIYSAIEDHDDNIKSSQSQSTNGLLNEFESASISVPLCLIENSLDSCIENLDLPPPLEPAPNHMDPRRRARLYGKQI